MNTPVPEVNLPDFFPVDKYELVSSSVTNDYINCFNRNTIWQCFIYCPKNKKKVPFGFLKVLNEVPTLYFHILPYNYPVFVQLFSKLLLNLF